VDGSAEAGGGYRRLVGDEVCRRKWKTPALGEMALIFGDERIQQKAASMLELERDSARATGVLVDATIQRDELCAAARLVRGLRRSRGGILRPARDDVGVLTTHSARG
jgi:hypothetical protein